MEGYREGMMTAYSGVPLRLILQEQNSFLVMVVGVLTVGTESLEHKP